MKILAIRGKNLASLAGEFEVDFQQEPLASSGLFAITGATGAGKSTLLDALCLALYNKTPRLARVSSQSGVDLQDVGSHTLKIHDVKNILRRGATEGYAEVDFIGSDQHTYRAKWSLRRARNVSTGMLQDEVLSLCSLPDLQPLGHKKTEVLTLIKDKIGLSFEEFNRAVLLAQNEFFAFLKADDNERAALLEALTGSQHFSVLSKQAFSRSRQAKDDLHRLQEHLSHQLPMSSEARQALELAHNQLAIQLNQEQAQQEQLNTQLNWYNTHDQLSQHVQNAHSALAQAQQQWQGSASRQHALQRIEHVQTARPLVDTMQRLHTELTQQSHKLTQHQHELSRIQAQEIQHQYQLTQAQTELAAAQQHIDQAKPQLEQAKKLDIQLEHHHDTYRTAHEQLTIAKKHLGQSPFKGLANWEQIKPLFSNAQDKLELTASQQALALAQNAQHYYQQQLASLQHQLQAIDTEALRQQSKTLTTQQQHLQTAQNLWQQWLTGQSQHAHGQDELQALQQQITHSENRLQELAAQLPILTARHTQAHSAFDAAKMACSKNVESLRQQLHDGQPCPVCGSAQHPYSNAQNAQLHQLLQELEQASLSLQQQVQALSKEQSTLEGTQTSAQKQLTTLNQQRQSLTQHLNRVQSELSTLPVLSANWFSLELSERQPWLNNLQTQLTTQQTALEQQDTTYRDLQKQREQAQGFLDASVLVEKCALALNTFVQAAHTHQELQQQRQQFFNGEACQLVEQQLAQALHLSQQHATTTSQQLQQLIQSRTQAQTAVDMSEKRLLEQQQDLSHTQQQLTHWLLDFNQQHTEMLDEAQLQKLLSFDSHWIKQEQSNLHAMHTAVASAETSLQQRQRDLAQHQQLAVETDKTTLLAECDQLKQHIPQHQQLLGGYQLQITLDNERQHQTSALQQQLAQQQQQADLWGQLNEVIGSSDGKKFRNAAQEMTLDVLLLYTNAHLHDLARRYRLQRVKHTLGLQVIDQDMGDEVRSVHSLSGGESFLVSLALALGLASLSSQRVKVESLFIDEGFGSLDAETLRVAMDALDILQGQGRKVGVISHVAEMTERIPVQIQIRKGAGGHSKLVVPQG